MVDPGIVAIIVALITAVFGPSIVAFIQTRVRQSESVIVPKGTQIVRPARLSTRVIQFIIFALIGAFGGYLLGGGFRTPQGTSVPPTLLAISPPTSIATFTTTPSVPATGTFTPSSLPAPISSSTTTPIPSTLTPSPTAIPMSSTPTPFGYLFDFEHNVQGWTAAVAGKDGWKADEKATTTSITNTAMYVHEGNWSLQGEFDGMQTTGDYKATFYSADLPLSDWRGFTSLRSDVYNPLDKDQSLEVTIALATGEKSCWSESTQWMRLTEEWNSLQFRLDTPDYKLCTGTYGSIPDMNSVRRLHLVFLLKEPLRGVIFIDNVRLSNN